MTVVQAEQASDGEAASIDPLDEALDVVRQYKPNGGKNGTRRTCGISECLGRSSAVNITDLHVNAKGTKLVAKGDVSQGDGAYAWKGSIPTLRVTHTSRGALLSAADMPLLMFVL